MEGLDEPESSQRVKSFPVEALGNMEHKLPEATSSHQRHFSLSYLSPPPLRVMKWC